MDRAEILQTYPTTAAPLDEVDEVDLTATVVKETGVPEATVEAVLDSEMHYLLSRGFATDEPPGRDRTAAGVSWASLISAVLFMAVIGLILGRLDLNDYSRGAIAALGFFGTLSYLRDFARSIWWAMPRHASRREVA